MIYNKFMTKIVEKKLINIGDEPVIILPLKKWKEIESILEDLEDAIRFQKAFFDKKNQKLISFEKIKKMLRLP
jgi:dTDP-glucose pyrophosphorylase